MKIRCPNCQALLRVPNPPQPAKEPRESSLLDDILGGFINCKHPENVKVNGKCLACEQERRSRGR